MPKKQLCTEQNKAVVLQVTKYEALFLNYFNYINVNFLLRSCALYQLTNILPPWLLQEKSLKMTWFLLAKNY